MVKAYGLMLKEEENHNIAQTAIVSAGCRALEHTRSDAIIQDPYACLFLDKKHDAIFQSFQKSASFNLFNTSIAVRTSVIDKMLNDVIYDKNIQQVVHLGAGFDTRPYRMSLPKSLIWWEIDHTQIIDYKAKTLSSTDANCDVFSQKIDLNNVDEMICFLNEKVDTRKRTLVLSEGLLIYLNEETVTDYLSIFSNMHHFSHWITDIGTKNNKSSEMDKSTSQFGELLDYMKFFTHPEERIFIDNNWKIVEQKDLAIEAIELSRPLSLAGHENGVDQLIAEINSLQWANYHYFLCLENLSYSD